MGAPTSAGALVEVRISPTGSYVTFCKECGQIGGSFIVEGHAYRHACTHYVSQHMPLAVWREVDA